LPFAQNMMKLSRLHTIITKTVPLDLKDSDGWLRGQRHACTALTLEHCHLKSILKYKVNYFSTTLMKNY